MVVAPVPAVSSTDALEHAKAGVGARRHVGLLAATTARQRGLAGLAPLFLVGGHQAGLACELALDLLEGRLLATVAELGGGLLDLAAELPKPRVSLLVAERDPLDAGERWISVERSWDDRDGLVDPKSKAGVRLTLLCETLRAILAEHVRQTGRSGDDLIFGKTATAPFVPSTVGRHAEDAWTAAKLERVTLHQCRHGFDSFLDAAGITEARADRYMGHAQNTVGDRYRHRLRGQLARGCRAARALPPRRSCRGRHAPDWRADWRAGGAGGFAKPNWLSLQNQCDRAAHGSVGSTPAPLRKQDTPDLTRSGAGFRPGVADACEVLRQLRSLGLAFPVTVHARGV
jgi:hypothetical protein